MNTKHYWLSMALEAVAWTISSGLLQDFFRCENWRSSYWITLPRTYSFAHSGWRHLPLNQGLFCLHVLSHLQEHISSADAPNRGNNCSYYLRFLRPAKLCMAKPVSIDLSSQSKFPDYWVHCLVYGLYLNKVVFFCLLKPRLPSRT